jgi:hypothetical protein
MGKLKFISASKWWKHEELSKDFEVVPNPTKYNNLPNGEYHIRGNKKNHAKYYWVLDNIWYLTETKTKDNGHHLCEAGTYQMFPPLSEKEWEYINKIPRKMLTKNWRRLRYGHNHWMDLREISRNIYKIRFKTIGK